jgi:ubiquinone/menaquinone biosynthesis C-methylase UbiE
MATPYHVPQRVGAVQGDNMAVYDNPIDYDSPPYFANLRLGIQARIESFLDKLLPPGVFGTISVLDVGCGTGKQAPLYISRGLRYTGIDPSDQMLKIAKLRNLRGTFINTTADKLPDYSTYFVVNCCSVLYHIKDIPAFIDTLCNLVAYEGYLILETDRPYNRFDRFVAWFSLWKNRDWAPEELNYDYSLGALEQLIQSKGFEIRKYGINFLTSLVPYDGTALNTPLWTRWWFNLLAKLDRHIAPAFPRMSGNFIIIAKRVREKITEEERKDMANHGVN